jgi:hypothetical protein
MTSSEERPRPSGEDDHGQIDGDDPNGSGPSMVAEALHYVRRGWSIIPLHSVEGAKCSCQAGANCTSPGKHPRTRTGVKEATKAPKTVAGWWKKWPTANIGIATGPGSGLLVLDIDPRHGGNDSLDALIEEHGPLPDTVEVLTGGGGRHVYFHYPEGRSVRNSNGSLGAGLDVRSDGGYVVAPPSGHVSGGRYEWEASSHPDDVEIAIPPLWLATRPEPPNETAAGRAGGVDPHEVLQGVPEGQRNDTLFRYACRMVSREFTPAEVEVLVQKANERCSPPLPASEIAILLGSAEGYRRGGSADSADSAPSDWDPPIPFYQFDLPEFPVDVLPSWLEAFVEAEATATQTPSELAAMLSLAVMASAAAKRVIVEVKDGWIEPTNIYTIVVLPSGSRKSAVFRDVTAPLTAEEQRLVLEARNEIVIAKEQRTLLENKLKSARKQLVDAEVSEQDVQDLALELDRHQIPANPRLLADDVTAEKLEMLIAEQGGRMAVFAAEADIFDIMAGRYASSGTLNLGVFLKAHAGDDIRVDRVNRPSVTVRTPALTMGLAVQPDVIDGLSLRREFRGRGLTPRFLYAIPESNIGRREINPLPVPPVTRKEYEAHITSLLALQPDTSGDSPRPHELKITADAQEVLFRFAEEIETELGVAGDLRDIVEWSSKLVGAVARIGGLLHLGDNANKKKPWEIPIPAHTMERAIQIGRYLIPHAKAAFALMGTDPIVHDARYILNRIEAQDLTHFTVRDLFTATKSRFKKTDNLRKVLAVLEEHGYVREREQPPQGGPGRPPSPTYDVNPLIHSQNPHNPQKEEEAT